jgi:hypothetical protein
MGFHPEMAPPQERRENPALSPLMRAKAKNPTGQIINFCPFGCEDIELDDNGYCRHLVGFTNDRKTMEPLIEDVARQRRNVHGDRKEPVLRSDKLVQVTVSYRVYRKIAGEASKAEDTED